MEAKLRRALGEQILAALDDPAVVEILLNPDGRLWVDIHGQGQQEIGRMDATRAESLIGTVAAGLGTVVNRDHPILEGELPLNGERFEGILPPVSPSPVFSIRKRASQVFTLADYEAAGILTAQQGEILRQGVAERLNIVVAGGCSSGKTTLANALLAEAACCGRAGERFVVLEDTVELQCPAANTVALRTSETADLTRLLRATLRLRPDRIIVGEVRGSEALHLLKAWNTGHPGGITTLHANSARAALTRLEQLIQEAGVAAQPALIAEAVNLIVFIGLTPSGRAVKEVARVTGWTPDAGYVLTQTELSE
ncbi:MAG: P-type conjugative transfer ATPase TrbB [Pseudomonadota bacterium]|nr:P-type conjugative transfer ATPase TrbB [Pseudomonadota bacterium]